MAKSEDFPGKHKKAPTWVSGVRTPAELPEPNLKVSVKEMLAQQHSTQSVEAPMATDRDLVNRPEILSSFQTEFVTKTGVIVEIKTEHIRVSPFQPRLTFSETTIEDLANSIAAVGLAKPITVRPVGAGIFELIGGERRWRAHKLLGRETITSYVREMDDAMASILALTDNEGQEVLTEYERGKSYASILANRGEPSIRALARRVGVNHSIVSRCLLLMDLPEKIRAILDENPALIGGKWAKDFIEFSKSEIELLMKAIIHMRDHQSTQEHALRWIAKAVAARKGLEGATSNSKFTDKKINGLGSVRVDGKRVEFRCEKNVNPQLLAEQFEEFLKNIDHSLVRSE